MLKLRTKVMAERSQHYLSECGMSKSEARKAANKDWLVHPDRVALIAGMTDAERKRRKFSL